MMKKQFTTPRCLAIGIDHDIITDSLPKGADYGQGKSMFTNQWEED